MGQAAKKYGKTIIRPPDPSLAVLKGIIIKCAMSCVIRASRCVQRHYLIGLPQFFKEGVDPEEYRIKSPDGYDRCMFTYQRAIHKGQRLRDGDVIDIPVTKVISPDESFDFEYTIYTCDEDSCPRYVSPGYVPNVRRLSICVNRKK